jgi:hypothetical protein
VKSRRHSKMLCTKTVCLGETTTINSIKWIRSVNRELYVNIINKKGLCSFDDKRYWKNHIESYAFEHYKIYSPTKVKHHLTCFNNIFSNNELISNRFAVFVTCTHILTYLWNRLLIDFYLCVYDRVCKEPCVLFNICVCKRKLIFFV